MIFGKTLGDILFYTAVWGFVGGNVIAAYIQNEEIESNIIERNAKDSTLITGYNFNNNYEPSSMIEGWNKNHMDVYPFVKKEEPIKEEINWYESPDSN